MKSGDNAFENFATVRCLLVRAFFSAGINPLRSHLSRSRRHRLIDHACRNCIIQESKWKNITKVADDGERA
jgi:hypothetical protein